MEKKGKWATIGRLGHKGRGVSISQLLTSRQITRDEAVAMVGDKIVDDFDQELKIAGNRLQRIGEQQYLAQAGKAFVKIELVNMPLLTSIMTAMTNLPFEASNKKL